MALDKDKTIAINAGQAANFSGFLIPGWQFRKMNQDLIEKDLLKKQLAIPQLVEQTPWYQPFLLGVLAGSMTILVYDKYGGK